MSGEGIQTTLEFFDEKKPQTYFCNRCGEPHKVGECPEDKGGNHDG